SHFSDRPPHRVCHVRDDPRAGRHHLDRHARRHRAAPRRRFGDGNSRRRRGADEPGAERVERGTAVKLFVDTGSIKDIEAIAQLGILDGVTTNPSLLAKEPGDYRENLKKICGIVKGPVSGEVTATDFAGMIREGHDIAKIDEHMVVKVPLTRDGIKACKALSGEKIRVNVTLCFSATQALLAAKAGASYISPFVGRLDDIATTGMH